MVPAARHAPPGSPEREFYVWSDTDQKFPETRIIFTDTEKSNWTYDPVAEQYLLAPLLLAPARPQSQQPGGRRRGDRRDEVLARPRRRRAAARRGAVSVRARGHQQREPAGDARRAEADAPRARRRLQEPDAAGRGEPVAVRRPRLLRRRRRMPHGVPLPADAAHVHGAAAGGSPRRSPRSSTRRRTSRTPASGRCSSATTTS